MKIAKKITISLSEEDVKNIVADHLVKEGYNVKSDDVKLCVGLRCEGYGYGERDVPYFRECSVETVI